MSDELSSSRPAGSASGSEGNDLSRALEELLAASSRRESAQLGDSTGFLPGRAGECPEPGEWLCLASGETSVGETDALLAHAATCAACVKQLRQSQKVLAEDASSKEIAEMAQFASSTPQWQHRLAVELAHTPLPEVQRKKRPLFLWAGAGLAASLLLAICVLVWWRYENAPERLLAQAYSNARIFDLRVPGAGFAEVTPETHLRGGVTDRELPQLLTARAQIERNLEANPTDSHWLQLQARADLLDERYDSAIDTLDRLLAAGPVTSSLLADDATAYFQRGSAVGSENDRATALDYLRRADEMAPDDPVVLFNEALVMEDRGQVINAVETWNRYLKFERDPRWQEEGRSRLKSLEEKMDRIKTHQSRMEQHLSTPRAMRALAADPATLAAIDEELSTTLLPHLLDFAFPLPGDRSRGSPCSEECGAARTLLHSLAASLEQNHQDPWLTEFLPPETSHTSDDFLRATRALSRAIDANTRGDYSGAQQWALQSGQLFDALKSETGKDRAEAERIYALQRSYKFTPCTRAAAALRAHAARYAWIGADATALDAACDMSPGASAENFPLYREGLDQAEAHHYALLELRARNGVGSTAVESGDTETAWRVSIESIRRFYEGDYPPFRVATTMAGLAFIEDGTPRVHLGLLLNRETVGLFELAQNRVIVAEQRVKLIRAAIRAGALQEAQDQMALARKEMTLTPDQKGSAGIQAESEIAMADLYLNRRDLQDAARMLDSARNHMAGEDNSLQLRNYAAVRGELELALGHPESAESTLRAAILKEELLARGAGEENVVFARQNRELYAALAGVWVAENRPGDEILALWERYRLRILGEPVQACAADRLDCLKPQVERALEREFAGKSRNLLIGQIVLRDRVLVYRADALHVDWVEVPTPQDDLLAAAASLERNADSPLTSQASVDRAARKFGNILMAGLRAPATTDGLLVLEPDPLLGNVPWPAVETADGPIGLLFSLEEAPSLLLDRNGAKQDKIESSPGRPLVVGASIGAGQSEYLPEVLNEARTVARFGGDSNLLLAQQATEARVAPHLASATMIHFAGHAAEYDGATRLLLAPSGSTGDKPYLDSDLFQRDPPRSARLVVFSACSSGKNEAGWNHGMGDIVDTLASLGVPEVVAARWQIDSASAVPMMDDFYQGLAKGLSVPQALTAARKSLIRDARYRHPYYWAAYYASGMGNTDLREVFHGNSR
jgi:tetratricopeptide (TPR) repeat protein